MEGYVKKVLVFGAGQHYSKYATRIKQFQSDEEIDVVGITSNDIYAKKIDDILFIHKNEVSKVSFDAIIITGDDKIFSEMVNEVKTNLVNEKNHEIQIIPCRVMDTPGFTFNKYFAIRDNKVSILSENCWGGITYNNIGIPFASPLINMSIANADYLKLMKNPKYYINDCELEFSRVDWNWEESYQFPCYKLDDVELRMVHYRNFEEAKKKWNDRKKRINYDNILAMTYTDSYREAEEFEQLPYKKKICFVSFENDLSSCFYVNLKQFNIPGRQAEIPDVFFGAARGRYALYDVWELLLNGRIIPRLSDL